MKNKYNKEQTLAIMSILGIDRYLSDICWFFISEKYDIFIEMAVEKTINHIGFDRDTRGFRMEFLIEILFKDDISMLPLYAVGNNIIEKIDSMKMYNPYEYLKSYTQLIMELSKFRLNNIS